MKKLLCSLTIGLSSFSTSSALAFDEVALAQFEKPIRLKAGGEYVQVEAPGYAAPCWADVDGDGLKDLLVGQFNGGKIKFYKGLGKARLAKGEWLQAGGKIAEVPGVW